MRLLTGDDGNETSDIAGRDEDNAGYKVGDESEVIGREQADAEVDHGEEERGEQGDEEADEELAGIRHLMARVCTGDEVGGC